MGIIKDSSSKLSGVRHSEHIFCMGTIKDSSFELSGVRNSEPIFCMGTIRIVLLNYQGSEIVNPFSV